MSEQSDNGREIDRRDPRRSYVRVAAALMGLLAVTVAVSGVPLGSLGVAIALVIAAAKAMLIALVFMHVRGSSRLTKLFAGAGVYWLLIMFLLTFSDYLTRG